MRIVDDYLAELDPAACRTILGDGLRRASTPAARTRSAPTSTGRSDIDVTAVVAGALDAATKRRARRARSGTRRCRARPAASSSSSTRSPPPGRAPARPGSSSTSTPARRMDFRVDHEPGDIEDFWFAIDRSILREHGKPLLGPPRRRARSRRSRGTRSPRCSPSRCAGTAATTRPTPSSTPPARSTSSTPATGSRSRRRACGLTRPHRPRSVNRHVEEEQAAQDAHPRGTAAEARAGELQAHASTSATRRPRAAATARARSVTRAASYSLTSGSAFSNASFACPEPVFSSGYSPEKQASQCVARSPSIAS